MTIFADDFNRADSSDLGPNWVEVSGDWAVTSNRLSPGSAGGTIILRAAGPMDSPDHYAQFTIAATAAVSQGVWCRGNGSGGLSSGYLWRNDGTSWTLFSVVGGSFTSIGSYTAAAAPGDTARVEAVGSTIKGHVNGIQRVSVVDTNVPSGTAVGIRSESSGAVGYDDFAAADVTAGATLGTAEEADSAQPLTGTKTTTLAPATEQDTAQALTGAKTATLSPAEAAESAQQLTGAKTTALTPAAELDAALALVQHKSKTLLPASETSTALPIGPDTRNEPDEVDYTVGQPFSVWDTGQPYTTWETGQPW